NVLRMPQVLKKSRKLPATCSHAFKPPSGGGPPGGVGGPAGEAFGTASSGMTFFSPASASAASSNGASDPLSVFSSPDELSLDRNSVAFASLAIVVGRAADALPFSDVADVKNSKARANKQGLSSSTGGTAEALCTPRPDLCTDDVSGDCKRINMLQ